MSNFVIAIFSDELSAQAGSLAVVDLHRETNATCYGTAIVGLGATGGLVVSRPTDQGSIPLGVGALVDGLVELFDPAFGASALDGSSARMEEGARDYLRTVVSDETLANFERELTPGKFAVVVEMSEELAATCATRMHELGGIIVRVTRENSTADLVSSAKEELGAGVFRWKAERAAIKARSMERNLSHRIDVARAKLRRRSDIARLRQDRVQTEMDAELGALQEQAALATPDVRIRIEQRLGALRNDLAERAKKLSRAYELTQEALLA